MKLTISRFPALSLAVAAMLVTLNAQFSPAHAAATVVQNGGFETGDFTGWSQMGTAGSAVVSYSASFVHSGIHGLSTGPVGSLGYIYQIVATVPGQVYRLSFGCVHRVAGAPN
jgi:hypothetical protein